MFNIPQSRVKEFKDIYDGHVLNMSACNIFFHHIRLIAKRPQILKRDDFYEYYNIFSDIELVTSPIDTFVEVPIPEDSNEENDKNKSFEEIMKDMPHIMEINRLCPEFVRIQNRITKESILQNFPEDHDVVKKINENPDAIDTFTTDCFIHWSIDNYLKNIDKLRLSAISNMTPIIEYIVDNISLKDCKNYLTSTRRINEEKCHEKAEDIFFKPDFDHTVTFYKADHKDIKSFDVNNLMKRLISNEVVKTDIYIICGIYMILTFCKVPLNEETNTDEKCVNYVRDVISQL